MLNDRRLANKKNELEWLYMELYGDRDKLHELEQAMTDAYTARTPALKRLDSPREFGKTIGQDPILHKKYLYEFFEGSFPGSYARGERYNYDPITQDAPDLCEDSRSLHRTRFNWDNAALCTRPGTVRQRIWDGLQQLGKGRIFRNTWQEK